jgi:hypothetical protein
MDVNPRTTRIVKTIALDLALNDLVMGVDDEYVGFVSTVPVISDSWEKVSFTLARPDGSHTLERWTTTREVWIEIGRVAGA